MSSLRKAFSILLLSAYSLVLLHGMLPHFHVDENGYALDSEAHHQSHFDDNGHHENAFFLEVSLADLFKGLFHMASDEDHMVHTGSAFSEPVKDATCLYLTIENPSIDFTSFEKILNEVLAPPGDNIPCGIFTSSSLRAPPVLA